MPRQGVSFVDPIVETLRPFSPKYSPPDWVDGMNRSFDTQALLSRGVPAVTIRSGCTLREGAGGDVPTFGDIHVPSDESNDSWRFDGAEEFLRMYEAVEERLNPIAAHDRSCNSLTFGIFQPNSRTPSFR